MRLTVWLLSATALASCASSDSAKGLNASALYDPPRITLKEGVTYDLQEGQLIGHAQHFYSQFTYSRAIIIGTK